MSNETKSLNRRDFIRSTVASVTGLTITGMAGIAEARGESIDSSLLQYREIGKIKLPLKNTGGVAIDANDRVYVSGDFSLLIYAHNNLLTKQLLLNEMAYCIAADGGDLFLGMSDRVVVLDEDGRPKTQWRIPAAGAILTSIAVSPGSVFLADAGHQTIWQFDKSGKLIRKIGEKDEARDIPGLIIPSPYFSVAVDPDGFLWAANTGRHCLENYTMDGGMRTTWGKAAPTIDGFCGCCNPSHFCIMGDGAFVTSEKGTPRVKVYDRLGRLAAVVALPEQFDPGTSGLEAAVDSKQRIHVLDPKRRLVRIFEKKA